MNQPKNLSCMETRGGDLLLRAGGGTEPFNCNYLGNNEWESYANAK